MPSTGEDRKAAQVIEIRGIKRWGVVPNRGGGIVDGTAEQRPGLPPQPDVNASRGTCRFPGNKLRLGQSGEVLARGPLFQPVGRLRPLNLITLGQALLGPRSLETIPGQGGADKQQGHTERDGRNYLLDPTAVSAPITHSPPPPDK